MSNNPLTSAEKIWRQHVIAALGDGIDLIHIDRHFLHELSGAISFQGLASTGRRVFDPAATFATVDHVIDTYPGRSLSSSAPGGEAFLRDQVKGVREHGITFFAPEDTRQGITHVVAMEQAIALPGMTFVCGDSHTTTVGALGALAWGVGSTDGEQVLVTQTLMASLPSSMRVRFEGQLPDGTSAKDAVLKLIATIGADGAANVGVEYAGTMVRSLSIEARATLCNMAVEMSARFAFVPTDDVTLSYLHNRPYAPSGANWDLAVAHWKSLSSDEDASFQRDVTIDCAGLEPFVTWGTTPDQAVPVSGAVPTGPSVAGLAAQDAYAQAIKYMNLEPGRPLAGLPVDGAFIGSCTNSRLEDLEEAARILRGRHVAPGVRAICTPGSTEVKRAAERHGIDVVFKAAGFEWREAGCSLCVSAGGESFGRRSRVISSTNHNSEHRQGQDVRSHLASPATVAASAVAGVISDPRPFLR
ncbi:3-isopropylmalate dehydratase large subunit [Paraburkholderia elongata]|uniref:3-isopropylmalate dehydratase n=1 Tax=Paraburkholderia elongata TaxID=2675747 RepID=A0A972SHJ3_9BURK|nr:3-isopropylmalate dehydratase large subunit [Paraburkholderia elongata]NPT55079.1 3-isopropylmalate dehydratase large subunit [Paraburkholderia elongata]